MNDHELDNLLERINRKNMANVPFRSSGEVLERVKAGTASIRLVREPSRSRTALLPFVAGAAAMLLVVLGLNFWFTDKAEHLSGFSRLQELNGQQQVVETKMILQQLKDLFPEKNTGVMLINNQARTISMSAASAEEARKVVLLKIEVTGGKPILFAVSSGGGYEIRLNEDGVKGTVLSSVMNDGNILIETDLEIKHAGSTVLINESFIYCPKHQEVVRVGIQEDKAGQIVAAGMMVL